MHGAGPFQVTNRNRLSMLNRNAPTSTTGMPIYKWKSLRKENLRDRFYCDILWQAPIGLPWYRWQLHSWLLRCVQVDRTIGCQYGKMFNDWMQNHFTAKFLLENRIRQERTRTLESNHTSESYVAVNQTKDSQDPPSNDILSTEFCMYVQATLLALVFFLGLARWVNDLHTFPYIWNDWFFLFFSKIIWLLWNVHASVTKSISVDVQCNSINKNALLRHEPSGQNS